MSRGESLRLFAEEGVVAAARTQSERSRGVDLKRRLKPIDRKQLMFRVVDVEELVGEVADGDQSQDVCGPCGED